MCVKRLPLCIETTKSTNTTCSTYWWWLLLLLLLRGEKALLLLCGERIVVSLLKEIRTFHLIILDDLENIIRMVCVCLIWYRVYGYDVTSTQQTSFVGWLMCVCVMVREISFFVISPSLFVRLQSDLSWLCAWVWFWMIFFCSSAISLTTFLFIFDSPLFLCIWNN